MKKLFTMILSIIAAWTVVAQGETKLIAPDLKSGTIPADMKLGHGWKIEDGVLRSLNKRGLYSINIDCAGFSDYDLEIKMRRTEVFDKDQHFGMIFKSATAGDRIYSRGDRLLQMIPELKIHNSIGSKFEKPLETGPDAPWTTFVVSVKGSQYTVTMDGKEIAAYDKFPQGHTSLTIYTYHVRLEISGLRLMAYKSGAPVTADAKSPNMALNASFEESTLDQLPDFWGVTAWGISDPYWILNYDKWQQYFRLDDGTAWHGKKSLRIENVKDEPIDNSLVLNSCNFGTTKGRTYTFSAYMKADRPGMKVQMYSESQNKPYNRFGKEITLTTDWQRYDYTYTRQNNSLYTDMLKIAPLNKGVVWIDAAQLELGESATPFQLANADRRLTVHEGHTEKELYTVPKHDTQLLDQAPVLDGRLNDPVWNKVKAVELNSVTGTPVKEKTTAKIFYTADGIYIGIDAEEAKSNEIVCTRKQRDDFMWIDPSIEIFLDSKLTRGTYHFLAFNVDGDQYDANLGDTTWNGNWQVKTHRKVNNTGWTAEVFLPFGELGINYYNGPLWGFNICRNNPRSNEISCWAPTYGRFHSPLRFGQLQIDEKVQKQYHISQKDTAVRYSDIGKGELSSVIVNESGKTLKAKLSYKVSDLNGKPIAAFEKDLNIPNDKSSRVIAGELSSKSGDRFRLESQIIANNKLLYYSTEVITSAKIMDAIVQYDYYTSEKELVLRGKIDLNEAILKKVKLEINIVGEKGSVYKDTRTPDKNNFETRITLANWENGNYQAEIRLLSGTNEISRTSSKFQKLPPASCEVKLDRFRRITYVNGKPYFPLGIFWEGAMTPELLEFLAKGGVRTIHTYRYQDLVKNPRILEVAQKNNVMFQVDVNIRKGNAADAINKLKDHPTILAWYTYDEIFTIKWGKENYDQINQAVEDAQKLDPYRPVVLLENSYGMDYLFNKNLYFPGKIPSLDCYAYPPNANIQVTNSASKAILRAGQEDGRPGWYVAFASGYGFHASRDMTPAEHEYMAYICVINGIRGIYYWASFPKAPSSFKKITSLFKEIESLVEPLISLDEVPEISGTRPEIKFTLKRYQDKYYLITVNESRTPVSAKFDLSPLKTTGKAKVLFEDRNTDIKNFVLEDTWQGSQRHVYCIDIK